MIINYKTESMVFILRDRNGEINIKQLQLFKILGITVIDEGKYYVKNGR